MKLARIASLVAMVALVACGDGEPDPSDDAGGRCSDDVACSDGEFCNGVELCEPTAEGADDRGCIPPVSTACELDCDEASNQCVEPGCADADGDGFYEIPCGGSDCDDADPGRFPGNLEVCDTEDHDEDCDPATVGVRDMDEDGQTDAACCNPAVSGPVCGTDCDDMRNVVYRGNSEVCDGFDNDCDTRTDEGVGVNYFNDCDGDGVGGGAGALMCAPSLCMGNPAVTSSSDCDDTNASFRPGAPGTCGICPNPSTSTETCNGVDDDCSGTADDNGAAASCAATPNGTSGCLAGSCGVGSCNTNYHVCGQACASNMAIATCGSRCTPCATPDDPNAHATCDGTSCGFVCEPPYKRVGDGCERLGASHVDDVALLPSGETALHVLAGQVVVIDTDTGGIADTTGTVLRAVTGDTSGIGFSTQDQSSGAPQLAIFTLSTITVDTGGTLRASGSRALVLLASGDVDIDGIVDVSATTAAGSHGPGGFGAGASGGPSVGLVGDPGASGGGGHGGRGGDGGDGDCNTGGGGEGGAPTAADASGSLLIGGSAGGGPGGGGGGAIQISSMTSILIDGTVRAVGAGGDASGVTGGGGAGGTVFLEALVVRVDGTVTVNGGGGGSGAQDGELGTDTTVRALGGQSHIETGEGGRGAAGANLDGGDGAWGCYSSGSGGGAGGRIWFITSSGSRTGSGLATPSGSVQERSETIE